MQANKRTYDQQGKKKKLSRHDIGASYFKNSVVTNSAVCDNAALGIIPSSESSK
jgi:hypothetical protein